MTDKWKDVLQKGIESGRKIQELFSEKGSPFSEILRSNLNWDVVSKGELFIPESLLERKISESLDSRDGAVTLESFSCAEDRIHVELEVGKLKIRSGVSLDIFIEEIHIGPGRQVAMCRVGGEKLEGRNLIGKIVAAIIHAVVSDLLKSAVSRADVSDRIDFSEGDRRVVVDLSGLDPIQKLMSPIPYLNTSVLDLVAFQISHRTGGLAVKADFSETGDGLKQRMARLASKAGKAIRGENQESE